MYAHDRMLTLVKISQVSLINVTEVLKIMPLGETYEVGQYVDVNESETGV